MLKKSTAPAARRLSSLREAGMISCGSSKSWRKSFQKNKKLNDSSTNELEFGWSTEQTDESFR